MSRSCFAHEQPAFFNDANLYPLPYQSKYASIADSLLDHFQKKLPTDHKFVIEIRNKTWRDANFADMLREYNVGLALTDTSFVPRPWEMKEKFDLVTADFVYVRWLGDRKGIEKVTKHGTKLSLTAGGPGELG